MAAFCEDGAYHVFGSLLHRGYISPLFEYVWIQLLAHARQYAPTPNEQFVTTLKHVVLPDVSNHYWYNYESTRFDLQPIEPFNVAVNELRDLMYARITTHACWFLVFDSSMGVQSFGNAFGDGAFPNNVTIPFIHGIFDLHTIRPHEGVDPFQPKVKALTDLDLNFDEGYKQFIYEWLKQE